MNKAEKAKQIVRDMERITPYVYESLYSTFLRHYMESDKSRWSRDLSEYLKASDDDNEFGEEVALVLWDRFEQKISC